MSDKNSNGADKPKDFELESFDDGTFYLYDNIFETRRLWKMSGRSKSGLAMLMNKQSETLPQTNEELRDKVKNMEQEEVEEYLRQMNKAAHKQIAVLASLVEPLDEMPDLWDTKIEYLTSCITESASVKIYAFFLIRSTNGTMYREEIEQEMMKILREE